MLLFKLNSNLELYLAAFYRYGNSVFSTPIYNQTDGDHCDKMRAALPESEDFSDPKRKCFIEIGQWIILVFSVISILGEVCRSKISMEKLSLLFYHKCSTF